MIDNAALRPNQLVLTNYLDPILRKPTQLVKFPLSQADKQTIADMLYSIHPEQLPELACGMAANQWGIDKSIFIYCPYGSDKLDQTEVIINPSYKPIVLPTANAETQDLEWEGCFSIPLATGQIKRDINIHVKYQNQHGEVIEKDLTGWPARVWQHENDHLNGLLYDDHHAGKCVVKKVFADESTRDTFYGEIREERRARVESTK